MVVVARPELLLVLPPSRQRDEQCNKGWVRERKKRHNHQYSGLAPHLKARNRIPVIAMPSHRARIVKSISIIIIIIWPVGETDRQRNNTRQIPHVCGALSTSCHLPIMPPDERSLAVSLDEPVYPVPTTQCPPPSAKSSVRVARLPVRSRQPFVNATQLLVQLVRASTSSSSVPYPHTILLALVITGLHPGSIFPCSYCY